MKLLNIMLATALVLDAAMVVATTASVAGSPVQTVGYSATDDNGVITTPATQR